MSALLVRRIRLAALAAAGLPLLLACGGGDGGGVEGTPSGERSVVGDRSPGGSEDEQPPGAPVTNDSGGDNGAGSVGDAPSVSWDDGELVVVANGSSTCPPRARSVTVDEPGRWVVDVTPRTRPGQACTMDLVPARSRIAPPDGVRPDEDTRVVIVRQGRRSDPLPVRMS